MCGVPYHAAENYISRLIRAGYKVAISEQMEAPGPGKKLVRREVVRVLTPGTATGASLIEAKENNYLVAVIRSSSAARPKQRSLPIPGAESMAPDFAAASGVPGDRKSHASADETVIGLALVDLSTGEFRATEFTGEKAEARLRDELGILRPREILLPKAATLFPMERSGDANSLGGNSNDTR